MKTKRTITVLIVLILTVFSINFASANSGVIKPEKNMNIVNALQSIKYPQFAKNDNINADVLVSFNVSDSGKIVLEQINSSSPVLMQYVKEQLQNLNVNSNSVETNKNYNFRLRFKLL